MAEPHARPVASRAADPDLRPASLVSPAPAAPLAPVTADATVSPAADAPAAPPPERYDEAPANAQAFAPAHRRPALRGPRPRYAARWDDGGCDDGDGGRFACGRGAVLHADRTLRAAYAAAVDAGVDRDQLVSIRNRWARLRMAEHDRPGALIEDYAELTDRLLRHADEAGGERE